jgi:hypothetical protein
MKSGESSHDALRRIEYEEVRPLYSAVSAIALQIKIILYISLEGGFKVSDFSGGMEGRNSCVD